MFATSMDLSEGQHAWPVNDRNEPSAFPTTSEQRAAGGLFCSRFPADMSSCFGIASPTQSREQSPVGILEKSQVEEMVSTSMNQLSAHARNRAVDELHGVEETDESPQKVEQLLQEMDSVLAARKEAKRPGTEAFILAELQDLDFVMALRLQFIRATHYEVNEAASLMLKYHEVKLKLFGYEKLTSHITLSDLCEEAIDILNSGYYQVMPFPDAVGRLILVSNPVMLGNVKTVEALVSVISAKRQIHCRKVDIWLLSLHSFFFHRTKLATMVQWR